MRETVSAASCGSQGSQDLSTPVGGPYVVWPRPMLHQADAQTETKAFEP